MSLDMRRTEELTEDDFVPVKWSEVTDGDVVYLRGTHLGNFRAYGPHRVDLGRSRHLRNTRGVRFTHMPEDLLKRVMRHIPCDNNGDQSL